MNNIVFYLTKNASAFWVSVLFALSLPLPFPVHSASEAAEWNFYTSQVQTMYVAYYGRPGDAAGVEYWAQRVADAEGNWTPSLVNSFGSSLEYTERFGSLDNEELIINIYLQIFNHTADPLGLSFYFDLLNGSNLSGLNPELRSTSLAEIALDIANGSLNDDALILENKLEVAEYFTHQTVVLGRDYASEDIPNAPACLDVVSAERESVELAFSLADSIISAMSFSYPINGEIVRVSVDSNGNESNGVSSFWLEPWISRNGRYVCYRSEATNLVDNDNNKVKDSFVHDLSDRKTQRISLNSTGVEGNFSSHNCATSGDGRYVAFISHATNLVANDDNEHADNFVRDVVTGITKRVSVNSDGEQGNRGGGEWFAISEDGRWITFDSSSSNLYGNDNNEEKDVFLYDQEASTTRLVSRSLTGSTDNSWSSVEAISGNGRFVIFSSEASDLVEGDDNEWKDLFLYDRMTESIEIVAERRYDNYYGYASPRDASISYDGSVIAVSSSARLIADDTDTDTDIYVYETGTGNLSRINVVDGSDNYDPFISQSGRYVAYQHVAGGGTDHYDVLVYDRQSEVTVSVSSLFPVNPNSSLYNPAVSDNAVVVFSSLATNLVFNDDNGLSDVFAIGPVFIDE